MGFDRYAVPAAEVDYRYTRPGTGPGTDILIDFRIGLHDVEATFTDAEGALLIKGLNTLSDDEIRNSGVHQLRPEMISPGFIVYRDLSYVTRRGDGDSVFFSFQLPRAARLFDPELGTLLLRAMGFPGRTVTP